MTMEQRMDQLEKRNKRLTIALTMMAVTICAVVTMAATGEKVSEFDIVTAQRIIVKDIRVENDDGLGVVKISAGANRGGHLFLSNATGRPMVGLLELITGSGAVTIYDHRGAERLTLRENEQGGYIKVKNKTGDVVAEIGADEYGNGVVYPD